MAKAPTKTKAAEPAKFDPAAPAPTPPEAVVRGRASRPTFRRGGLVFGDRDWTPIDPEAIGAAASLAIVADPVITLQGRGPDGQWAAMPADIRKGLIEVLQAEVAKESAASKADA